MGICVPSMYIKALIYYFDQQFDLEIVDKWVIQKPTLNVNKFMVCALVYNIIQVIIKDDTKLLIEYENIEINIQTR